MIQFNFKFFIVALSIFIFTESFSQTPPVISNINSPNTVEQYDMIEISFDIDFYGDPPELIFYDPADVDVYAIFTNIKDGITTTEKINAFYYEGYNRSSISAPNDPPWNLIEVLTLNDDKGWKIRYTPESTSNWQFEITAIDVVHGLSETVVGLEFQCDPSDRKSFIGISQSNNRYFEYSNGGNYLPIGQNIGWYKWYNADMYDESLGDMAQPYGTYEYDHHIAAMQENGANYFRNWIGHYRSLSITPCWDYELSEFFYNRINQKDAWRMDYIVGETGNSSPRINIMPCFFTHQFFIGDNNNWNIQWEQGLNPYRIADAGYPDLPGTCVDPWDFFINPDAIQVTKNSFRYIVARWGYATNILSWELFNEVNKLYYEDEDNMDDIEFWHQIMYQYITVELGDKHLVSTSFTDKVPSVIGIICDDMDFSQAHSYKDVEPPSTTKFNKKSFEKADSFLDYFQEIPYLFGETGFFSHTSSGWENDPHGYQNHCMNFASLFTGAVGATAYWWWRDAYSHNYAQHYKPVSEFASNLELFHDSYSYTYVVQEPDPQVDQMTHLTYMVSENNEFVAGWGQDDDFEFNSLLLDNNTLYLNTFLNVNPDNPPDYFENRNITIDGLKEGLYSLKWFNTEDGTEIKGVSSVVSVEQGENIITIPSEDYDTPYGDFSFIMNFEGFRKEPYLVFQNEPGPDPDPNNPYPFTSDLKDLVVLWQFHSLPEYCTIHWGTDENCTPWSDEVDPFIEIEHLYKYPFLLSDLEPETQYYYKVIGQIDIESEPMEFLSSFVTPPAADATDLTFFAYGDTRGEDGVEPYRSPYHEIVCDEINNQVNPSLGSQTFILNAGDWNYNDTEINWDSCYFSDFDENSKVMKSQMPVMGVYGNHESPGTNFRKYWPYSYDDIDQSEGAFYYSYDYGPVHFTFVQLKDQWAEISTNQMDWIKADLSSNKKWKVVIFHAPGYSNSEDYNDDVRDYLQPLCEQYGVQLVIAGHFHYYAHWLVNGVHHLTLGGGGAGTYNPGTDLGELMVLGVNHFAKININDDIMNIIINSYEYDEDNEEWLWKDDFDTFTLPVSLKICGGTNETWNEDITYVDEIRVCEGSTLTIKSEVSMVENGLITVECGGILYIDGGKITSVNSEKWQGIKVLGDVSSSNIADQGLLLMNNGAVIENSTKGIFTDITCWDSGGPGGYIDCFGIVRAQDASFINNDACATLENSQISNYSFFRDCSFVVNESDVPAGEEEPFVSLIDMDGVDFEYCDFRNEVAGQNGRGIYSTNSSFSIDGICDPVACSSLFEGFEYGVYATAVSSTNYINMSQTHFDNNYNGVYISGMENLSVTECNFTTSTNNAGGYGLYLDACTGFTVEENYFEEGGQDAIGIIVNNSGPYANRIYRNDFQDLKFGIIAQNKNRSYRDETGLELRCNDYENTGYDHVVTWDGGPFINPEYGIAAHQGSDLPVADEMAGNLFFVPGPANGDYDDMNNGANDFIYYYPQNFEPAYSNVEPKDFTDQTITDEAKYIILGNWNYDNGCPPTEAGGGGSGETEGLRSAVASAEQDIATTNGILAVLVDGGDTEALNSEVETSLPPESMQVYNELMGSSPYLSDSVVSSAIEKEDVLPNAMIRDIMVANPQTAKSNELMVKLDERWDPLPDYMKAQILQGKDIVSIKEELESHLASHKQKKAKAFNRLVRYFLMDTLNPVASSDSLVMMLQEDGELSSKYSLAMLHLDRGEMQDGLTVLNTIAGQYNLQGDELSAHQDMLSYYNLLSNLKSDNKSILEVDGGQVGELLSMEAAQQGMAAVYARGILLALNEIEYQEPIILPDMLKSSEAEQAYHELMEARPPKQLEVYPNPSDDYVIIQYKADKEIPGSVVEVTNMNGSIVKSITITNQQDQVVVDAEGWKPGVYIATLNVEGNPVESVKFTIVK